MNEYEYSNDDLPPFAGNVSGPSSAAEADPGDVPVDDGAGDSLDTLRGKVISLIDRGEVKRTHAAVKKLGRKTLEKILAEHAQNRIEETNEMLSDALLNQLGDLMGNVGMVKELNDNDLFKRDAKTLISHITPYIPMIGLVCGGLIVAKHVWATREKRHEDEPEEQNKE
jgi:hypothetical protein